MAAYLKNYIQYSSAIFASLFPSARRRSYAHSFKSGMELKGNFLVGADGVHSNVRNVLKLPPILKSDITNYRGNFLVPETASTELQALLEKGIVPLYTGNGKELYFIVFNFHSRHTGRLAWLLATNLHVADDDDV